MDRKGSYTQTEFAELVGVKRITVYRWIKKNSLKTVDVNGGRKRIPESEAKRFLGIE